MSAVFERIASRFFGKAQPSCGKAQPSCGKPTAIQIQTNICNQQEVKKKRKSVRIQEDRNEVFLISAVEDFIAAKREEQKVCERALQMRLRSVEQKPFVPPVGTVLTAISKHRHLLCAAVVLPDHRLMEVQRGSATGMQLYPRFLFNSPYEWQCWVNRL